VHVGKSMEWCMWGRAWSGACGEEHGVVHGVVHVGKSCLKGGALRACVFGGRRGS